MPCRSPKQQVYETALARLQKEMMALEISGAPGKEEEDGAGPASTSTPSPSQQQQQQQQVLQLSAARAAYQASLLRVDSVFLCKARAGRLQAAALALDAARNAASK